MTRMDESVVSRRRWQFGLRPLLLGVALLGLFFTWLWYQPPNLAGNWDSIRPGMTMERVVRLIGYPGHVEDYSDEIPPRVRYFYKVEGVRYVVEFCDGNVVSIAERD